MIDNENLPNHIAIIMDGNRRWAKENGLPSAMGHKAGAENLENLAIFANKLGIKYLTVYAFSTENWKRSQEEVKGLMFLLEKYVLKMLENQKNDNIKLNILGDISVLEPKLQKNIIEVVEKNKNNTGLVFNIAFNYGGRAEIVRGVKDIAEKVKNGEIDIDDIDDSLISNSLYTAGQPDPDLVIRTSGELRTSNFLPWQIVYSEFYFPEKHWPDFKEEDLLNAIEVFQNRNRRFGGK